MQSDPLALTAPAGHRERRNDFPDKSLVLLLSACVGLITAWFIIAPYLPRVWREPGSAQLYSMGVCGALLLLLPAAFSVVKRAGLTANPVAWFNAHVWCSCLGAIFIVIHSAGFIRRPPALLLACLVALAVLGVWARLRGSRLAARTFGSAAPAFQAPDAATRARLRELIAAKCDLLPRLDPQAREPTFSVTLRHALGHPRLALKYAQLAAEERRLVGRRDAVDRRQAWWRPLHLALAAVFVFGVLIHVVTVTFFAGYVAGGGPITWWHVTAW